MYMENVMQENVKSVIHHISVDDSPRVACSVWRTYWNAALLRKNERLERISSTYVLLKNFSVMSISSHSFSREDFIGVYSFCNTYNSRSAFIPLTLITRMMMMVQKAEGKSLISTERY